MYAHVRVRSQPTRMLCFKRLLGWFGRLEMTWVGQPRTLGTVQPVDHKLGEDLRATLCFFFFLTVWCTKRVKETVIWRENFRSSDIYRKISVRPYGGRQASPQLFDIPGVFRALSFPTHGIPSRANQPGVFSSTASRSAE